MKLYYKYTLVILANNDNNFILQMKCSQSVRRMAFLSGFIMANRSMNTFQKFYMEVYFDHKKCFEKKGPK